MSENTKQETENDIEVKPVEGGEAAEPEAIPSEPEVAKESETETSEEIGGKSETVTLDAEEHRKMKEQAEKAAEYWDRLLRLQAEFENFKKRMARERSEASKYANEALLESLIPALDNFDIAMAAIENAGPNSVDSLKKGVNMVFKQLRDAVREWGMEEVNAVGQMFNPAWHEAVEQRESNEVPEEQVIEQIRKGYKLKDRLIRPAKVVVAKPKAADSADDGVTNKTSAEDPAED